LGITRDAVVAAVVRRHPGGLVVVETLETWEPQDGPRVALEEVGDAVRTLARTFNAPAVFDPGRPR
jgi:hypothetical protein